MSGIKFDSRQMTNAEALSNFGLSATASLDSVFSELNKQSGQLQIRTHSTNAKRVKITGVDVSKLNGSTLGQTLNTYLLLFSGAEIDFSTGSIYASDGTTPLGTNFTPFDFTGNPDEYAWYSISLISDSTNADNTLSPKLEVVAGASSNTTAATASKPVLPSDGMQLGFVYVQNDSATSVTAINDITYSNIVQLKISEQPGAIISHIADTTIHFTESSIDHTHIQNIGVATHAQIDTAIMDLRKANAVINGNFDSWQYATTVSSGTTGYVGPDRWFLGQSGGTREISQVVGSTKDGFWNPAYYLQNNITVATSANSDYINMQTRIENVGTYSGKDCTLSFNALHSAGADLSTEIRQNFGSGGSSTVSVNVTKQAISTGYDQYIVNFTMPSVSAKTIGSNNHVELTFWFSAGSDFNTDTDTLGHQSGIFWISGAQLLEGTWTKAQINKYNYAGGSAYTDSQLCKRYHERNGSSNASGEFFAADVTSGYNYYQTRQFRVEKRVAPTVTFTLSGNSGGFNSTTPTVNSVNESGFTMVKQASSTAPGSYFLYLWTASAEL